MPSVGNIKDQDLSKIWISELANLRRNEIKECSQNCHQIMNCWYEEEYIENEESIECIEVIEKENIKDICSVDNTNQIQIGEPHFSDITITNSCMLKCKMCKAWENDGNGPHLTYEDCKLYIDYLSEFVKRPIDINVMGGEPLMVPWVLDLCGYIAKKGFKSIISTNAYLIDEDMAKRIADSGLDVLAISLESLNPEMHDTNRGRDGLHKKIMQGIEYLDKYVKGKPSLTLLSIIMHKNLDELVPLAEWVNRHRLFNNISYLALLETGLVDDKKNWFRSETYKELWPQNVEKLDKVIDEIKELKRLEYKIWNPLSQLDAFKEYYREPELFMQKVTYKLHGYVIDLDEEKNIYLSGEKLGILGQKH